MFLTHGVIEQPGPLFQGRFDALSPEVFAEQVQFLNRYFDVIALKDALDMAQKGQDLKGKCCLTFDDGYSCLSHNAFPILESFNVPATVFIVSDLIDDKTLFWRDCIRFIVINALEDKFAKHLKVTQDIEPEHRSMYAWSKDTRGPKSHILQSALQSFFASNNIHLSTDHQTGCDRLYLTRDQIEGAPSVIDFGNHTASHPVLPTLLYDEQFDEIQRCKNVLKTTGRDVDLFCLPFGKFNGETLRAAKAAGYNRIVHYTDTATNNEQLMCTGHVNRVSFADNAQDLGWNMIKAALKI